MATTITGDPAAVSDALVKTVNDATNASPIVIQTTTAHGYASGDTVVVSAVGGNTAANGTWVITVVDATHFSLNGSTGNAAYTAGGSVTDTSLTPYTQIPSDADPFNAAAWNVSIEVALNRTQFLNLKINAETTRAEAAEADLRNDLTLKSATFTADGTFTPPTDCTLVYVIGCGGGGGGAAGAGTGAGTDKWTAGGGGGGGAEEVGFYYAVTPGVGCAVVIGAGGASANDGADSTFDGALTFKGAQKGGTNSSSSTTSTTYNFSPGGSSMAGTQQLAPSAATSEQSFGMTSPPNYGGAGVPRTISSRNGVNSPQGFAGGTGASGGTDTGGSHRGGGGGGGGGAGPYGAGANGGVGGNGNDAGAGTTGTNGSSASANTGAGGGGGGAGGGGTSGSSASSGGSGGSGQIKVVYVSSV